MEAQEQLYKKQLGSLQRFFEFTYGSAFLFAIANDEKLIAKTNDELVFLLKGKHKPLQIHSWKAAVTEIPPLTQLKAVLENCPNTKGLILIDLEAAVYRNPNLLTQLNFAREELSRLGIPLLFWINTKTIQLMQQQAMDLYDQRAASNIYFDEDMPEDGYSQPLEHYKAIQIASDNSDLLQYKARLVLLQKQLNDAETQGLSKEEIANDLVVELLGIYVEIPGMAKLTKTLLTKYLPYFDKQNPDVSFTLALAYKYFGDVSKAEDHYIKTLETYRNLEKTHSQAFLPDAVASTLNNLAILLWDKNKFSEAEKYYIEALEIYKELAKTNPQLYLPPLANTLNNFAGLLWNKKNYNEAKKHIIEALEIYNELAHKKPDTYLQNVANTLNHLAILLSDKKEYNEAEKNYTQALEIYRSIAKTNPQAFLPDIATNLSNLANTLTSKKEYAEAEKLYTEALEIRQDLVKTNPQTYLPDVAITMNNLAALLKDKKENTKAEKFFEEVLELFRELAKANPQTFLPNIAFVGKNMAVFYQDNQPNKEKSIAYAKESIQSAFPFIATIPATKECYNDALDVIKKWGLNTDVFLKGIGKEGGRSSRFFRRYKKRRG